jgi:arylsulfatase A-like enzyme
MPREGRPNVIVFFTDQQRHDSTGVHGNPLELTPNFDRMAQAGTHCYNAFTCQPVCAPARSSLQTGLYATKTGVFTNGQLPMRAELKTLAHYYRDAGYTTGYIGKWHLAGYKTPYVPVEERGGYEYWLGANALEATSDTYRCDLYDGDNKPVRLPGYRVDALTDAAIPMAIANATRAAGFRRTWRRWAVRRLSTSAATGACASASTKRLAACATR